MTSNAGTPHLDAIKGAFLDAVHADHLNPSDTFDWVQAALAGDQGGGTAYPFGIIAPPGEFGEVQFVDLLPLFGPRTWFVSNLTLIASQQGAFTLTESQVQHIRANADCDATGSIEGQSAPEFDGWFAGVPFAWRAASHVVRHALSPTDTRWVRGGPIVITEDTVVDGVTVPGRRVEKCRSRDLAELLAWARSPNVPITKY